MRNKVHKYVDEGGLCLVIFTTFVLMSMYNVKSVSTGLDVSNDGYSDFTKGFSFIDRKRDAADYEWENAKTLFFSLFPWMFGHVLISELVRNSHQYILLPLMQSAFTIFFVLFNFNIYCVVILIYQPLIFKIFSKTRQKFIIWCCAIINLAVLQAFKSCDKFGCVSVLQITDLKHTYMVLSVYWIYLRCICYCINHTESNEKVNLANMLSYCLYLPTLFFGPFINYDEFIRSQSAQNILFSIRLKTFITKVFRFLFWWVFTDIWLHYIYINVLSLHPQLVYKFDSFTLYGFGYCMGQFFHLKYVVMYGLSTTMAEFDNIPVPNIPKCIGRIHLYSDMWKYFDNGLYKFLLRYIYLPIKQSTCKEVGSFVCFLFVYIWHGFMRTDILIWTLFNYVAISIEYYFNHLYKQHLKKCVIQYLDTGWERRLICAVNAPLLMFSAVSNFYFFGGVEIGHIFVIRILTDKLLYTILLLFTLYCCGQLSIMVKEWEKAPDLSKVSNATGK